MLLLFDCLSAGVDDASIPFGPIEGTACQNHFMNFDWHLDFFLELCKSREINHSEISKVGECHYLKSSK